MHVTQLELSRNLLNDLEKLNRSFANANRQLSTTKKLNYLGDSPIGSADLVDITQQALKLDAFRFNMIQSSYKLKASEAALNVVFNTVTSIFTLGSEAATETTGKEGREAILIEITKLRDELVSRGNTQLDGIYIFAGTAVDTKAFAINATTGHVEYYGNQNLNDVQIGDGVEIKAGVDGKNALMDIFKAVDKLIDAINTMNGNAPVSGAVDINEALGDIGDALDTLNGARGEIGVNISIVDRMSGMLDNRNLILREQRANIEDANLLEVATQIGQLQIAINAALSSGSTIIQQHTLFDLIG